MLRKSLALLLSFMLICSPVFGADTKAKRIRTITSNFGSALSGADTNVQLALDTLDDIVLTAEVDTLDTVCDRGNTTNQILTNTNTSAGVHYLVTGANLNNLGMALSTDGGASYSLQWRYGNNIAASMDMTSMNFQSYGSITAVGEMICGGTFSSSTSTINMGSENLVTTGTLDCGATTITLPNTPTLTVTEVDFTGSALGNMGYAPLITGTPTVLSSAVALHGGVVVIYDGANDPSIRFINSDLSLIETMSWDIANARFAFGNDVEVTGTVNATSLTDNTATLTGGILNGLTDINATATTDLTVFGTTDVADDADGNALWVYRMAAEDDHYFKFYTDQYKTQHMKASYGFEINIANHALLNIDYSNIYLINGAYGDVYMFKNATSGENPVFHQAGYITAAGDEVEVRWKVDDVSDYFLLTRENANILGLDIQMPLVGDSAIFSGTLGCGAITSLGASTFNSGSVDADFTVNWNTGTGLFVQGSNGFVGMGTATPLYTLQVAGPDAGVAEVHIGAASQGDARLFLQERTGDNLYGISWEFLGDENTWAFKNHNNSDAGANIMTGSRDSATVGFAGTVEISGALTVSSGIATFGSYIQVVDYGAFFGGVHVGGAADPGTDNLVVDGFTNSVGGYKDNGTAGVDGTFEDKDSNTITVSGGIITDLGV